MAPFWHSSTWREIFAVDRDPAEVEGLAAGTGILTGDLVEGSAIRSTPCGRCGTAAAVVVETVDLVNDEVTRRCERCGRTWTSPERPANPRD